MEIEAGGSADALNRSSQAAEPLSPIAYPQLWLQLEHCKYQEDEQETAIRKTVERTLRAMTDTENNAASAPPPDGQQQERLTQWNLLFGRLMRTAATCKNKAFQDEKEWRLVAMCPSHPDEAKMVKFRCRKGLVVPYWPIALDADVWGAITVVVGPTAHPDESRASIERLLGARCHHNCQIYVRNSEVPYRHW